MPKNSAGLLVLDKPPGITSRHALNHITRLLPKVKVGHAGTLDPMASGVLVVCFGPATRLVPFVQQMTKEYAATLRLGQRSATHDLEAEPEDAAFQGPVDRSLFEQVLAEFRGAIAQVPPQYSAVHVHGRRAYELARAGHAVPLAARSVTIERLVCTRWEFPIAELEIRSSSGTYIRSLARDIGERLGCGAVLSRLVRTAVGPFRLDEAISPLGVRGEDVADRMLPASAAVAKLPPVEVREDQLEDVMHGRPIPLAPEVGASPPAQEFALYDRLGTLLAVAERDGERAVLRPRIVLMEQAPAC